MTSYAVPGQPLSSAREGGTAFAAGPGTFERHGTIYSSTVGLVERHSGQIAVHSSNSGAAQAIPEPGAIVIGTVTRINSQAATLSLLTVDDKPCRPDYQGVIRAQDVRATNKDSVKTWNAFRPQDVVRAKVISLGDARSYYLSTAENSLGVLFAVSTKTGNTLEPVNWESMRDPVTGEIESRKCAGPADADQAT